MRATTTQTPTIAPLLRSIDEAQAVLGGIGRTTLYELIGSGDLKVIKLGRRTFIAQAELERFVEAAS
jgi:excisionase family DNA binding protein